MSFEFRLAAISPIRRGGYYTVLGYDKASVTQRGSLIKLEGTSGAHRAQVLRHNEARHLIAVRHDGYTSYVGRGTGNAYSPARITIYEYRERVAGNEVHLYVDLFGIMELPTARVAENA